MAISFKKYGWERRPEEDFSDDGNRFLVYRHVDMPELRLTKLNAGKNDGFYIDFYFDNNTELTHDEICKLPKIDMLYKLNCGCFPTQEEVDEVCEAVLVCYAAYKEKLANIQPVDMVEVEAKLKRNIDEYHRGYLAAKELFLDNMDKFLGMEKYDRSTVLDSLIGLKDQYERAEKNFKLNLDHYARNRASATSFLGYKEEDYTNDWYFKRLNEKLLS